MAITVDSEVDLLLYPAGSEFSSAKSVQNDFGLNIKSITYGFPEPKTNYIPVPHSSLVYDYTNIYGATTFGMRTITAELMFMGDWPAWHASVDALRDYINGVDMCIVDKSDADWFYQGRATMEPTHDSYYMAPIKIEWECLPFKMSVRNMSSPWLWDPFSFETGIAADYGSIQVSGSGTYYLIGSPQASTSQASTPLVTTSAPMSFTYNGTSFSVGTITSQEVPGFEIQSTDLPIVITGTGVISISYTRNSL